MSTPNCTTPPHVPGTESCGGVLLLMTATQWGSKKYMNMKHLETMEQEPQVG